MPVPSIIDDDEDSPTEPIVYFQQQNSFSNKCAICCLNNLLGGKLYTTSNLDQICKTLSSKFINPYKSIFGGDYDVSVIIYALNNFDYEVKWLKPSDQVKEQLKDKQTVGFILNSIQKTNKILMKILDFSGRHWTAVRLQQSKAYYLDSKKKQPEIFLDLEQLCRRLEEMRENGGLILAVKRKPEPKFITVTVEGKQIRLREVEAPTLEEDEEQKLQKITSCKHEIETFLTQSIKLPSK